MTVSFSLSDVFLYPVLYSVVGGKGGRDHQCSCLTLCFSAPVWPSASVLLSDPLHQCFSAPVWPSAALCLDEAQGFSFKLGSSQQNSPTTGSACSRSSVCPQRDCNYLYGSGSDTNAKVSPHYLMACTCSTYTYSSIDIYNHCGMSVPILLH